MPRDGIVDGRLAMVVDEGEEVGVDVVIDEEGVGVVVEDSVDDAGVAEEEIDESEAIPVLEATLTDEATPVFEATPTGAATLGGTSTGVLIVGPG